MNENVPSFVGVDDYSNRQISTGVIMNENVPSSVGARVVLGWVDDYSNRQISTDVIYNERKRAILRRGGGGVGLGG